MADNTPQTGANTIATDEIGGIHYQRVKVTFGADGVATDVSADAKLPVDVGTVAVTGSFYQTTQPVSIATMPTTPVTGTFWQATQPISGTVGVSGSVAVTGTFWQATQPVSGPLTDTQLRAQAVPVSLTSTTVTGSVAVTGTFWQATQPVSGTVTITPPTLTKATQGSTGLSVQNLKDAGRTTLAMTAEFAFAQTAETLLTMTLSSNGATTTTFTSRTITSGKRFRVQSAILQVELLGSGTTPQRAYLRMRANTAGATTASSPLQWILPCGVTTAIVKATNWASLEIPDGFELAGDGTATFGFTLETPEWVTTTATGRAKITVFGFEY